MQESSTNANQAGMHEHPLQFCLLQQDAQRSPLVINPGLPITDIGVCAFLQQQLQNLHIAFQSCQVKSGAAVVVSSVDEQAPLQQVLHGVDVPQGGSKGHGTQSLAVALLDSRLNYVFGPAQRQRRHLSAYLAAASAPGC